MELKPVLGHLRISLIALGLAMHGVPLLPFVERDLARLFLLLAALAAVIGLVRVLIHVPSGTGTRELMITGVGMAMFGGFMAREMLDNMTRRSFFYGLSASDHLVVGLALLVVAAGHLVMLEGWVRLADTFALGERRVVFRVAGALALARLGVLLLMLNDVRQLPLWASSAVDVALLIVFVAAVNAIEKVIPAPAQTA